MKIKGLDELSKSLDTLAKSAQAIAGENTISVTELLTPDFVSRHTRFANSNEMFQASGFKVETPEDFKAIPDEKWDEFIRAVSPFQDWQSMLSEAHKVWTLKKLGL